MPRVWADARQTPLSHSLCQHVVARRRPLVVQDCRHNAKVRDNLAVRDLSVIAYAGFPLVLEDGHAVGSLCVIDTHPRSWRSRELRILADLAAAVKTLLDLRRAAAHHGLNDRLTGLPGRELMFAYAERMSSTPASGELLAVALGIDNLSALNETYGAQHGDRVLTLVSRRVAGVLAADDVLGRLQGDVFAVLRPGVEDQLEAIAFADRIREAVCQEPMRVRGEVMGIKATVGIARGAGDVAIGSLILRAVDEMQQGKGHRASVLTSNGEREQQAAIRLRLRAALRGAVSRGEITVAFQPIVGLADGKPRGFEALARWQHPELGAIGPNEFIPIAEASGEISSASASSGCGSPSMTSGPATRR